MPQLDSSASKVLLQELIENSCEQVASLERTTEIDSGKIIEDVSCKV